MLLPLKLAFILHFDAAYGDMIEPALVSINGRSSESPVYCGTGCMDETTNTMLQRTIDEILGPPDVDVLVVLMDSRRMQEPKFVPARCRIMSTPMNSRQVHPLNSNQRPSGPLTRPKTTSIEGSSIQGCESAECFTPDEPL